MMTMLMLQVIYFEFDDDEDDQDEDDIGPTWMVLTLDTWMVLKGRMDEFLLEWVRVPGLLLDFFTWS